MTHYYHILGLHAHASKEDIRKAYRKLAMRYHPDVNASAEAKAKFIEIQEAYEYLMGLRQKKQTYFDPSDIEKARDILEKIAKEKAKAERRARAQKIREKKEKEQTRQYTIAVYSFIGVVILIFTFSWAWDWYYNLRIGNNPVETTATIVAVGQNEIVYQYEREGTYYQETQYVKGDGMSMYTDVGMPLKIGDEFALLYNRESPSYQKINFERVSSATMNRYLLLVSKAYRSINMERWKHLTAAEQKRYADCMSLLTFKTYGYDGLSTVIYRDSYVLNNLKHNKWRWYFMRSSDKFKAITADCDF